MLSIITVLALLIVGSCKIFVKYGKKWWEALIAGYNFAVILEMVELPLWNYFLFLIPFVNIYMIFKVAIRLAKAFGKGTGFGVGLVLLSPIFIPILAFSKAPYIGLGGNVAPEQPVNPEPAAPVVETPVAEAPVAPVVEEPAPVVEPVANESFPSMSNIEPKPASESTITEGMPEAPAPAPEPEQPEIVSDAALAEMAQQQTIQNTDFINNNTNQE